MVPCRLSFCFFLLLPFTSSPTSISPSLLFLLFFIPSLLPTHLHNILPSLLLPTPLLKTFTMFAFMDMLLDKTLWPAYLVACFVFYLTVRPYSKSYLDVPTVKFNRFLPNFFNRLLFFIDAPAMVQYGYTHVSYLVQKNALASQFTDKICSSRASPSRS